MTQTKYEQKKQECWKEYCTSDVPYDVESAFDFAFDRAYALGKLQASCGQVKEEISQEDIEKASINYIRTNPFVNSRTATTAREAFEDGMKFALGKQEKDAEETVICGWVARDKTGYLVLHYKEPHRTLGNAKWYSAQSQKSLPRDSFPDLTWESDPIEVEIIIKRRKK